MTYITSEQNRTKKSTIVDHIITDIINGDYTPGEKLRESLLAEKYETSRAPVREALLELASLGFVQQLPRRGFSVTKMTKKEIIDCYTLAGVVEGYALAQSMHLFFESDLMQLESILEQANKAVQKNQEPLDNMLPIENNDNMLALSQADNTFHNLLCAKYDNSVLHSFSSLTKKHIAHYIYFREWKQSQSLESFFERHKKIVDCIRERNTTKIEQVMREHYIETGYRMAECLEPNPMLGASHSKKYLLP